MDTVESLGYLKGLLDGLELDDNKKETKLFKAIIDVVENLSKDIDDVYEELDSIWEETDNISEDLSDVEEAFFGDECDDCPFNDDDEEDEEDGYELTCPLCGAAVYIDADADLEEGVQCPSCGEMLQIDVEPEDDDEE